MDPVAAIGLVASIITFLDFSHKVVSGTLELRASGSTSENVHISTVIDDLYGVTKSLHPNISSQSDHERALQKLASNCEDLSKTLLDLLKSLQTGSSSSLWADIRTSLRNVRKKSDVEDIEKRIAEYRSQIMLRLTLILNDRNTTLKAQVDNLLAQSSAESRRMSDGLEALRDNILPKIESIQKSQEASVHNHDPQLDQISALLNSLLSRQISLLPELRVLKQLWFDSMYQREDTIRDPVSDTYRWVIESADDSADHPARLKVRDWLRNGNGVFHLSGKAGSGKSTLMRFILHHPQTKVELKKWAADKRLIFASFFFYQAGGEMQRSLQGLYRSILFEVLREHPQLIPTTFPRAFKSMQEPSIQASIDELFFRVRDIQEGFTRLIEHGPPSGYQICLLIDGLDEYGADSTSFEEHLSLAKSLAGWSNNPDVKILASSRPYIEFLDTFAEHQRIHLHQLNERDIADFCTTTLGQHKQYLSSFDSGHGDGLVDEIVTKSQGVFLWARLVVRSLLRPIARGDSIESLRRQVETTPEDLDKLYSSFFEMIDDAAREKAFKLLLVVAHNNLLWGLNPLVAIWLDELDQEEYPGNHPISQYPKHELDSLSKLAKRQILGLTGGLLEMVGNPEVVQFFHRTARDFAMNHAELRKFSLQNPIWTSLNTRLRLLIADVWFTATPYFVVNVSYILSELLYQAIRGRRKMDVSPTLLKLFERIVTHHRIDLMSGDIMAGHLNIQSTTVQLSNGEFCWPQLFAVGLNAPDLLRSEVLPLLEPFKSSNLGNLLFSASLNPDTADHFKLLLELGAHPHDEINFGTPLIKLNSKKLSTTVWVAFLMFFVPIALSPSLGPAHLILQYFLEAGANPNCWLLLRGNTSGKRRIKRLMSLRSFITSLGPRLENIEALLSTMDKSKPGFWQSLSRVTMSDSTSRPPPDWQQYDRASDSSGMSHLEKIHCGNIELDVEDMRFQVF